MRASVLVGPVSVIRPREHDSARTREASITQEGDANLPGTAETWPGSSFVRSATVRPRRMRRPPPRSSPGGTRRCSYARSRWARFSSTLLGTASRGGWPTQLRMHPRRAAAWSSTQAASSRVMLIDQCTARDVAQGKALGINLVSTRAVRVSPPTINWRCCGAALAVLPIGARRTRGPGLVGWTYPDEPDNNGWTPASLAKAHPYDRGNVDGLVTFLTTTGRFYHQAPVRLPTGPRLRAMQPSRGSPTWPGSTSIR